MSDFPAQTRLILEKVVQGKLSKIEASERLGVSRKTIYQWLKKYSDWKPDSTPTKRKRLQKDILRIIVANPEYGPRKISQELEKVGKKLSERSVWKLLCELGIATANKRKVYTKRYRQPRSSEKEIVPGHLRLNAESRKRMVEEVILAKRLVKDVVAEYGVSRKTFAKWKRRYVVAQTDRKNILLALSDQNPKGSRHPRGISERMEQAVLDLVSIEPELSSHKIAKKLKHIGNHGVQKVLERLQLSTQEARLAYVRTQKVPSKPIFVRILDRVLLVWEQFVPSLAPAPPPLLKLRRLGPLLSSTIITAVFAFIIFFGIRLLVNVAPYKGMPQTGLVLATVALTMGSIFFLYSLKYYLTLAIVLSFSQQEMIGGNKGDSGKRRGLLSWILGSVNGGSLSSKAGRSKVVGLEPSLEHIVLKKHPVISVHIPLYNEKKVVERALRAASSFDYPQYEIIFADDSTDETTTIINKYQKSFGKPKTKRGDGWVLKTIEIRPGVIFKHLHRTSRSGFKGGALKKALEHTDKKAEFISVFDADFVPYPDTLELFLKYFKVQNNMSEDYKESDVAAVQGYQWHVLNKSENWITRGVRTEYAGSYVVERSGSEIIDSIKQISGSAYCIRRDLLDEIGWGTSITEDFELTLKLYERGYRIVYTPYVQAPAECVSTMKDLVRQRMRWAEGHSNNIKKMFTRLLFKSSLRPIEKLEFLYLSPYYLQAFFFLIGTICWILTETIYPGHLPFWTSLWGWSMVLTNFLSLPLMNAVGLFLEESEEKDYIGLASFIALSYLLVPFLAYASLKGFLEREEGPWFRTPKTGKITDIFTRGKFYRFISGVIPGFRPASIIREAAPAHLNQYLALATANNQFNSFNIRPRRKRWLGKAILSLLLALTVTVYAYTRGVPETLATPPATTQYLSNDTTATLTGAWKLLETVDTQDSTTTVTLARNQDVADIQFLPGSDNGTAGTKCGASPNGRGWILDTPFGGSGGSIASGTWSFFIYESDAGPNREGHIDVCVYRIAVSGGSITSSNPLFQSEGDAAWNNTTDTWDGAVSQISQTTSSQSEFTIPANEYIYIEYWNHNTTKVNEAAVTSTFYTGETGTNDPYVQTPTIIIPENAIVLLALSPAIPYLVHLWMKKKGKAIEYA